MSVYEPLMLAGAFLNKVISIDFIDKAGVQCDGPVLEILYG